MIKELRENMTMKFLLEETNYAFKITMDGGGSSNSDYADYTSNNFINGFRHVLQKPDLSRAQLASMLREAERRQNKKSHKEVNWAETMAKTISQSSNSNFHDI